MATITSTFYDTTPGEGITETEWAKNRFGGAPYGVNGAGDWRVTAVAGQDRTISIAKGGGFGYGVADESDSNHTIQLPIVASGSVRWDLVAVHRDWQPAGGGPSSFTSVQGSAAMAIPAGRANDPGVEDDQPLALIEVIPGQSDVGRIIDLRCFASVGSVEAVHDIALSYLSMPGATVRIGGRLCAYQADTNGVYAWKSYPMGGAKAFAADAWMGGAIPIATTSSGNLVTVARINIPDPGHPYHLSAQAIIESAPPSAGTRWDARLESPGQPRLALSRGDIVAPWYDINGFTTDAVSGATHVDLVLARLYGSATFGISNLNRMFRVMQHPA